MTIGLVYRTLCYNNSLSIIYCIFCCNSWSSKHHIAGPKCSLHFKKKSNFTTKFSANKNCAYLCFMYIKTIFEIEVVCDQKENNSLRRKRWKCIRCTKEALEITSLVVYWEKKICIKHFNLDQSWIAQIIMASYKAKKSVTQWCSPTFSTFPVRYVDLHFWSMVYEVFFLTQHYM